MACDFNILAENEFGYIGQCSCCEEFNFAYKNILVTFSEEHLFHFSDWLIGNQNNPEFLFDLPHGKSRVYRSPVENLFLTFDEGELSQLSQLFTETQLVLEARKIVGNSATSE
jgi:hypothetical protein